MPSCVHDDAKPSLVTADEHDEQGIRHNPTSQRTTSRSTHAAHRKNGGMEAVLKLEES